MKGMIVEKSWFEEAIKTMSEEDFNLLCAKILDYGLFEEIRETGNPAVDAAFESIISQIESNRVDVEVDLDLRVL